MKFLSAIIYLSCVIVVGVKASVSRNYCYNDPELSCTEKHVLECTDDHVITTDLTFGVTFYKNINLPECRTNTSECKNKTTCCKFIKKLTEVITGLKAYNTSNPVIDFIKTNCSFKSNCTVKDYYNNNGDPGLYDYVTYTYDCISAKTDEVTADFIVNGSTHFTGDKFLSIYYLDYNGTKESIGVKLNRECVVSTTTSSMTLIIKKLNLQADDCCRFQITGFNVSEYCSENGPFASPKRNYIDRNTATIKLENVTYKDGDSFSISIETAGNVTIECNTIEDVNNQDSITCDYSNPSTITNSSSISSTTNDTPTTENQLGIKEGEIKGQDDSETNLARIVGGTVVVLVVLVVVIIVVVVVVRIKRRKKERAEDTNYYTSVDEPKGSPNYTYIDVDLDNVGYSQISDNGTGMVTNSGEKSKNAKEIQKSPKLKSNEKCRGTKYARKRSVPNENVDDVKVRDSSQYTYIDSSKIRPDESKPAAFATDNIRPNTQTGKLTPQYSKVDKKQVQFTPNKEEDGDLDNYNHVGLNEPPPRDPDAEDHYNHIDSNVKIDNSLPKGNNSKPTSNYSYADVDQSEDDVLDDTYDHAQCGNDRTINQQGKKERDIKDTYHHIGIKNDNSLPKGDNYHHNGNKCDYSLSEGDTYDHIGNKSDNSASKGDNYNHIGNKNDNSVSKGDNYNHIEIEFPESEDTYNHTHSDNRLDTKSTPHSPSDNYHHINL